VREGRLIEFKDKKRVVTAVCTRVDSGSARILTEANKEFNLPLAKVLHEGTDLDVKRSRTELIDSLKTFAADASALVDEIDLAELWELLHEDERPYPLTELASFLVSGPRDVLRESALLRRLIDDPLYFDQVGGGYQPRSPLAVEQTLHQRALEQQRAEQKAALQRWMQSVWAGTPPARPAGADGVIRLLQDMAIFGNRGERYQEGVTFLQESGLGGHEAQEAAFQLLVRMGEWDEDENLQLHEHGLAEPFSPESVAEAAAAAITPELIAARRDLRHLHLMSIDDEETKDIDDALSLEMLPEGLRVGIHVADVATFVTPGSALDETAKRRSTSIYLPDRKIDMLPPRISHDLCSLVAHQDRLALTVLVTFDKDGKIIAHEIVESVVNVRERLTYDEVDEMLEARQDLQVLQHIAQDLLSRRVAAGAVVFTMPELRIRVDADKTIHLKRIEQTGPSQRLVSEMMVVANQLIAEYLLERQVPSLYRTQPAPEEPVAALHTGPADAVALFRQRKQLKRSELSTDPSPHFGLGVKVYTQATSPIRRYSDLLVHRQLKRVLHGEPPVHTIEEMKPLGAMTEQGISIVNLAQRQSYRYWLLKYLQDLPPQPLRAVVLDVWEEQAKIQLIDYLLEVPVYPRLSRKLQPGDQVMVAVDQLRPRRGTIALALLDSPPAE
jgi:exoribonuclease-2